MTETPVDGTTARRDDETTLAALDVIRDCLTMLKVTANKGDDPFVRFTKFSADVFIDAPFSDDVKHSISDVFNVAVENYVDATRQIKTHKTARAVSLREFALSIFASCFVLFNRKK